MPKSNHRAPAHAKSGDSLLADFRVHAERYNAWQGGGWLDDLDRSLETVLALTREERERSEPDRTARHADFLALAERTLIKLAMMRAEIREGRAIDAARSGVPLGQYIERLNRHLEVHNLLIFRTRWLVKVRPPCAKGKPRGAERTLLMFFEEADERDIDEVDRAVWGRKRIGDVSRWKLIGRVNTALGSAGCPLKIKSRKPRGIIAIEEKT